MLVRLPPTSAIVACSGLLLPLTAAALPPGAASGGVLHEPPTAVAAQRDVRRSVEVQGTFVPREGDELGFWPEKWSGELTFVEIASHGSYVNSGDVVARFDTRRIDEEIETAERDLSGAEAAHALAVERAEQETEVARERLEDARYAFERARTELEGWERHQLDFQRRSDELQAQNVQNNLEDQQHELEQLEAMYAADELVEMTEEIVLARSRRDLARSRTSQKLGLDRDEYERRYDLPAQDHAKRQAAHRAETSLARLERLQALEARTRADGVERSKVGLEEKREQLQELREDLGKLVLRAPRGGVVLHGGRKDQGPGRTRPQHEVGGKAGARAALFTVFPADALEIAVSLSESQLAEVRSGAGATVRPLGRRDVELAGRLELAGHPVAGGGPEAQFEGRIVLERVPVGTIAGTHGKVELAVETLPGAVLVPAAAALGQGAEAHVWVLQSTGQYESRAVELGPRIDGEIVVRAGVQAGDRVLLGEPQQ